MRQHIGVAISGDDHCTIWISVEPTVPEVSSDEGDEAAVVDFDRLSRGEIASEWNY